MLRSRKNRIVIRLRRRGHIYYALYEIVVVFRVKRRQSSFHERLGFFNPQGTERLFFLDGQRLAFWLGRGAILKDSVKRYLVKFVVEE